MKVILFGATGMVGQGALLECLHDPAVESVLVVGRSSTGVDHAKLREILLPDLTDLSTIEVDLSGLDACFFPLGTSSAGMSAEAYREITYDLTLSVAGTLARINPGMVFVYVSGAGTDSSEKGRVRWARVKGETENALLALPLRAYMLRPGYIHPVHGVRSKTRLYATIYTLATPLYHLLKRVLPKYLITTEQLGRSMVQLAEHGSDARVLESPAIYAVARERDSLGR
jgi:uncharacterized protein YbjT (DUF2867 family)